MRKLLLFLLVSIALPALAQNGKKVYADFHGVRYTRQHDGKLGRWEMYANTEKSSTGRKSLCYNADLIDSEGRHEIAAVAYPQVGMQSNLDPDYIEYLLRLCLLDRCCFHQRSLYSWPPRDYPEVCLDKGRSNDIPVHGHLLHLRYGIYLHSVIIIAQHSSMEWVDKVLAHSS